MRLAERLDRLPVLGFHWRLLALCGAGWILDSVDTGLVGMTLADLSVRWNLSHLQSGLLMSSGMVGLLIGVVLSGWAADRYGRRPFYLAAPALFSVFSLLVGVSWGPASFALFRLFLGISIGGEFAVGTALLTEYVPAGRRGRMMVLLDSFWAVGSILAAVSAYLVIPTLGWRAVFFINVLPAALVALARRQIPESPRFLALHGHPREAHRIVADLEKQAGLEEHHEPEEPREPPLRPRLRELLRGPAARATLQLWWMWFSMTFVYLGMAVWLPSIFVEAGYELRSSIAFMLAFALAQIPGYVMAAMLIERLGRRWSLTGFSLAASLCCLLFGMAGSPGEILFWGCSLSFFNLAAWGVLFAYTAEQFPTRFRASGTASCVAIGRAAGILSPVAVAGLLESALPGRPLVLSVFGVLLFTAGVAAWFGRETGGRSLEEIHGE
ncbi:MAG: MFS transporter [Acidobacteriota bacterium]|nr:MFS transporter [Acidobacteriota bacterium]